MKMVAWGALLILVYCASTLQLTNANYFGPRQYHSFENDESIEDSHSDEEARPYANFGSRNGYSNVNYYPSELTACGQSRQQYGRFKRSEVEAWRDETPRALGRSKHLYEGVYPATKESVLSYVNGLSKQHKTYRFTIWHDETLQVKGRKADACGYWTIKGLSSEVSYDGAPRNDNPRYTNFLNTKERIGELKTGMQKGHLRPGSVHK